MHPPEFNHFVTLTYENPPRTLEGVPTLSREDGRLFRRRLGKALGRDVRFFWAGEYGESTQRPHYHAVLFGLQSLQPRDLLQEHWGLGHVHSDYLTIPRCNYAAGYVMKKIHGQSPDAGHPLRHVEFAQMSRRPAIADGYVKGIMIPYLHRGVGQKWIKANGDVPSSFRANGKMWPFTDRHRRMMRKAVGLPERIVDIVRDTDLSPRLPDEFPTVEELTTRSVLYGKRTFREKLFKASSRSRAV